MEVLFTAAVYDKGAVKTYVIASNAEEKDKDTVAMFISAIYQILPTDPELEEDVIWSDGCGGELKNQFMAVFLRGMVGKYKRNFHWKFFATSHGKGVVDGVGGVVKRVVRQAVVSRQAVVNDARTFAKVAKSGVKTTTLIYVDESEILRPNPLWTQARKIKKLRSAPSDRLCPDRLCPGVLMLFCRLIFN